MTIVQVFQCPACGKKMTRRLPRRKRFHKSYCESTSQTVRMTAVTEDRKVFK